MSSSKIDKSNKLKDSFITHRDEGVNFCSRIIQITGTIGEDTTFEMVDAAMSVMESSGDGLICVRINSHGGHVYEAMAIVGRLRASPCRIRTEGFGSIMSAAVLVLACGNERFISPYTMCMHHEDSAGFYGTTTQIQEAAKQMQREEELWAGWMAQFSKWSKEEWLSVCHKTNYFMTAEEAVTAGMADDLLDG